MKSSNISQVNYDAATKELTVTFRGGESYVYSSVDEATYKAMMESPSQGQFFYRNIRDRFQYRRN